LTGDPAAVAAAAAADGSADQSAQSAASDDAPITYTDFKLPDGYALDDEIKSTLHKLGNTNKWKQEQVQQVVDLGVQFSQRIDKLVMEAHLERMAAYRKAVLSDAELSGSDRTQLPKNLGIAKEAALKIGGQPFLKALVETGAENHPEVVRFLLRLGNKMQEDALGAHLLGGAGQGSEKSPAEVLYPQYKQTVQ
jgi:hypothetical protein